MYIYIKYAHITPLWTTYNVYIFDKKQCDENNLV